MPALPEFDPPADLWPRIEQRYVRQVHRRRLGAASAIAAVLVATVAMFSLSSPPRVSDAVSRQRSETMQLEQDWQALGAATVDSGYARLRPVDVALQQAYDRHADGSELDRLWGERNQVLRDLIRNRRDAVVAAVDTKILISI